MQSICLCVPGRSESCVLLRMLRNKLQVLSVFIHCLTCTFWEHCVQLLETAIMLCPVV